MDKFVLIDGNSLINRAYYATPPMSTLKGMPTNAVYSFCNMLVKLIEDVNPKYILVAFDRKEPTFRHKLYADYKGTRKPAPEDLISQIGVLKEVLDAMGIAHFELSGVEADDIIGTLAKRYPQLNTIIITGDKDSFQLVDETTEVHFTKRGITELEIFNEENFKNKLGIEPKQIIDLKSLMGDSSDNIPGVKGVGEKTALELVQKYESLEGVYAKIDEIKGKLKERLQCDVETAKLSKLLATIDVAVEIPMELENFSYSFPLSAAARQKFAELEFKNLLKKEKIFSGEIILPIVQKESMEIKTLSTELEISPFVNYSKIAVVIDENIDFYVYDKIEYKLKIKANFFDDGFDFPEALCALKPIFENENATLIVYYKNQLRHLLDSYGIKLKAKVQDVSIIKYLVDYSGRDDKLSELIAMKDLDKKTPAYALSCLYEDYLNSLQGDEKKLYEEVELPLTDVLYDMECAGFKINMQALEKMGEQYKNQLDELQEKIYAAAGERFNINSPKQLGQILFEKLGLKHGKKKRHGFSTSAEILEELVDENEIVPLILKYRQIAKLFSTYIEGYKNLTDKRTGLVHTTFNQVQTATGRLSSREPNLQNIPIRDDEGREIRRLFSARDDEHILIDADYSQIELRLLAHFCGSEPLIEAFKSGGDVHTLTASQVFGVSTDLVTREMRASAKAVNFGIIYGISDFGLAKNLKIPVKTAASYIKRYFEMYPNIKEYMDANVDFAKKNGYAVTLLGRKRYIREINSSNYNLRAFGERVAMNMPLQGTAADIIKIAMNNVYRRLIGENLKSKLILQVHDELIIDALKSESDRVAQILKEEMEHAVELKVPLGVQVSVCENWYDAK